MLTLVEMELKQIGNASSAMAEEISDVLAALVDKDGDPVGAIATVRSALRNLQEVEFRCQALALAVRQFALVPCADAREIWDSAGLADTPDPR